MKGLTQPSSGLFLKLSSLLFTTLIVWTVAGPASAQANTLVTSIPAPAAVLHVSPSAVSLTTTSSLMDQGNSVAVTDSAGTRVDDGSISINDITAVIGIKSLTETGVYTVNYTLLAINEDPLIGSYTFRFKAPPIVSGTTSASPTPSVSTLANGSTDTLIYALLVASFFIFILMIWYAMRIFKLRSKKHK
jgi:methionine-rich copper-binding protein CopC